MAKIKVYDLSPDDEGKFINQLNFWEMKTVYAGYAIGATIPSPQPPVAEPEQAESALVNNARTNLAQWMDSLELQIQDLRQQLGIR
jgi:hypothetical protein